MANCLTLSYQLKAPSQEILKSCKLPYLHGCNFFFYFRFSVTHAICLYAKLTTISHEKQRSHIEGLRNQKDKTFHPMLLIVGLQLNRPRNKTPHTLQLEDKATPLLVTEAAAFTSQQEQIQFIGRPKMHHLMQHHLLQMLKGPSRNGSPLKTTWAHATPWLPATLGHGQVSEPHVRSFHGPGAVSLIHLSRWPCRYSSAAFLTPGFNPMLPTTNKVVATIQKTTKTQQINQYIPQVPQIKPHNHVIMQNCRKMEGKAAKN